MKFTSILLMRDNEKNLNIGVLREVVSSVVREATYLQRCQQSTNVTSITQYVAQ